MVSSAQLFPEELPDRDKSYDAMEPDFTYYYKCPRRFSSHERTGAMPTQYKEARGDYTGVFFDARGKNRYNFSKMYIKKKDGTPPPTTYNVDPKWTFDKTFRGDRTLKFYPSQKQTFIDDIRNE